MNAVLEVGPAVVRVLGARPGDDPSEPAAPALATSAPATAALGAADEPFALLDERPVATSVLWRTVLRRALGEHSGPVTVVHPSWWPAPRVGRALAAAAAVGPVVSCTRAELLRRRFRRPAVIVEFADDVVAVVGPAGRLQVLGRDDSAGILAAVTDIAGPRETVLIDAPAGVVDVAAVAEALRDMLSNNGISTEIASLESDPHPGPHPDPAPGPPRRAGVPGTRIAVGVLLITVLSLMIWSLSVGPPAVWFGPARSDSAPASASSTATVGVVEGRIAVEVPAGWPVRRVTDGPGSRRLEVVSPSDASAIVHITGAYAPQTTVADTARVLRRAAADEPPGVFTAFAQDVEVAGRPAVTYREVRPARVVEWTVVVDGAMRISVGCQSPPAGPGIRTVCDAVIGSARDAF